MSKFAKKRAQVSGVIACVYMLSSIRVESHANESQP